jgi:hypothetical protein
MRAAVSITTRPAARRIKPPSKRSVIGAPVFASVSVEVSGDISADGPDGVLVSALLLVPGEDVGMAPSGIAVGVSKKVMAISRSVTAAGLTVRLPREPAGGSPLATGSSNNPSPTASATTRADDNNRGKTLSLCTM